MGAFENFQAFLAMGGYAAYVWPAYALAAAGLIGALVLSRRTLKARERDFDQLRRRRGG
jgi:heme exporter protein D